MSYKVREGEFKYSYQYREMHSKDNMNAELTHDCGCQHFVHYLLK